MIARDIEQKHKHRILAALSGGEYSIYRQKISKIRRAACRLEARASLRKALLLAELHLIAIERLVGGGMIAGEYLLIMRL